MGSLTVLFESNEDLATLQKVDQNIHLSNYVKKVILGAAWGSVRAYYDASNPVAASGTATLVSVPADDTITIGGVTLTAKASPANENQFNQSGNDGADATSLAAIISAHSVLGKFVSASANSNVVTITSRLLGQIGNLLTLARTGTAITLSGATLANGTGGPASAPVVLD